MPPSRWKVAKTRAAWRSGWRDTIASCGADLQPSSLRRLQPHCHQRSCHFSQCGEPLILGQAVKVAIIDLLDDHRNFEHREHIIEDNVGKIAACLLRVALGKV